MRSSSRRLLRWVICDGCSGGASVTAAQVGHLGQPDRGAAAQGEARRVPPYRSAQPAGAPIVAGALPSGLGFGLGIGVWVRARG